MVKKVIGFFTKEFSNLNQAAFLLGSFAFLSQILGLARDRSLAHYLGPSSSLYVYYAAFRIPDFIFISVASLASFTVLIPFLMNRLKDGDNKMARDFLSNIFSIFLIIILAVSSIVFLVMPYLAKIIAPGFSSEMISNLVVLSRIMLVSPILLGLSNLLGSVTQIYNKFFIYALSPILYNLGILVGVILFYPIFGLNGLALGVVLGAFLHFIIQIPVVIKQKFIPKFSFFIDFKEVKETVLLSLPRTIGLAANNIALIAMLAFASTISEGSVSIFNFAMNLQVIPVTIFGVSYSVAVFPTLSKSFSIGDIDSFIERITASIKQIIFWSIPTVFLFIILRAQIVRVILGSGRFTWSDTKLTAAALVLFALSVLAQSLIMILVRGFYAAGKTKVPLYVNVIFSTLSIIIAFGLISIYKSNPEFQMFTQNLLRVDQTSSAAVLMLPLAYSIATILNFTTLWYLFRKNFSDHKFINLSKVFWQVVIASFGLGLVTYNALGFFDNFLDLNTFWGILGQGFLSGILGIITAILILYLLKNEELSQIWRTIHTKFWKTRVISPAQENLQNVDKI